MEGPASAKKKKKKQATFIIKLVSFLIKERFRVA